MIIDLNAIRYNVSGLKKKKGVQVKLSPEDLFMIQGVQSATHSRHITNEYFLKIELGYDGCTCCSNLPDASMPFTIIPIVNPACVGFKAPPQWAPTALLGSFMINLNFIK